MDLVFSILSLTASIIACIAVSVSPLTMEVSRNACNLIAKFLILSKRSTAINDLVFNAVVLFDLLNDIMTMVSKREKTRHKW